MSRALNKLSAAEVKAASPREKLYRIPDGGGLFLTVKPNGSKLWHFRYKQKTGKWTLTSFGSAQDVSLKVARNKREEARKRLYEDNTTPAEQKRADATEAINTFKPMAEEWMAWKVKVGRWTNEKHIENHHNRMANDIYPFIGNMRIADIEPLDVRKIAERIQGRGAWDTAERAVDDIAGVINYANGLGIKNPFGNPARVVGEFIVTPDDKKGHMPALLPEEFPELLRAWDTLMGGEQTVVALELLMLTVLRPDTLVSLEWNMVQWDMRQLLVPGRIMKKTAVGKKKRGFDHIVPLSTQAMNLLRDWQQHTGKGKFLFPSTRTKTGHMVAANLNMSIKRAGREPGEEFGPFKGRHCAHGFRSTFSSYFHALKTTGKDGQEYKRYTEDAIEFALAHMVAAAKPNEAVKKAYDRGAYLDERRRIMQAWGDWIEEKANEADNVVVLKREAG